MRIVFIAPRFHTNQFYIVQGLQRAGHEVHFLVLYSSHSERHDDLRPTVLGVAERYRRRAARLAPAKGRAFLLSRARPPLTRLWQALRGARPDVVVIRNPHHAFGRAAVLMSRLLGARVLLYTQGPLHVARLGIRDHLKGWVAWALGGRWITPVEYRGLSCPPHRRPMTEHIPFPIEPSSPSREPASPRGPRVRLLAVGKFIPRKNHHLLVEMLARAPWRHQVTLTIVGEVSAQDHERYATRLRETIERAGLNESVCLLTNVAPTAMHEIYATHDVFVFPATGEPAAFSVLEAMAHGLAIVTSPDNGTSSYVGEEGHIVDFADQDRAIECIGQSLDQRRRSYDLLTPSAYVRALERLAIRPKRYAKKLHSAPTEQSGPTLRAE